MCKFTLKHHTNEIYTFHEILQAKMMMIQICCKEINSNMLYEQEN